MGDVDVSMQVEGPEDFLFSGKQLNSNDENLLFSPDEATVLDERFSLDTDVPTQLDIDLDTTMDIYTDSGVARAEVTVDDIFRDSDDEEDNAALEASQKVLELVQAFKAVSSPAHSTAVSDTDSEDSDRDREGSASDNDDESTKADDAAKKSSKKHNKRSKKGSSAEGQENGVVQSEIEAVKRLEAGPTEDELRRRAVIDIDEDELEEQRERLKREGMKAMSRLLGHSDADVSRMDKQKLQQLRACRGFLRDVLQREDEDDYEDFIGDCLGKHGRRVWGDVAPPLDLWEYLDRDSYSDDEEEGEKEQDNKKESEQKEEAEEDEGGKMIYLSDSEDDDEDESLRQAERPAAPVPPPAAVLSNTIGAAARPQRPQRACSARASLLCSLRMRASAQGRENYCHAHKIKTDTLQLCQQISENVRLMLVLLKERSEEKGRETRELKKQRYEQMRDQDDEEFDGQELGVGVFLTEEERERLMRGMDSDDEEEEDEGEEDEGEGGEYGEDEDEGEGGEEDAMAAAEQDDDGEEQSVEGPGMNGLKSAMRAVAAAAAARGEENDENQEDEGEEEQEAAASGVAADGDDDEEVEQVRRHRGSAQAGAAHKKAKTLRRALEEDDEEDGTSPRAAETGDNQEENEQGAAEMPDADAPAAAGDDTDEPAEQEASREEEEAKAKAKKKASGGNVLFRMQLEEEARRARSQKKSSLLDEEAEEEEETGGLGDFGFTREGAGNAHSEEMAALVLRGGELDHIVDELSDGEDEGLEENMKIRAALDREADKQRTLKIIRGITGDGSGKAAGAKKGFSFDAMVRGTTAAEGTNANPGGEGEAAAEQELDEEELLQRGLAEKLENLRRDRQLGRNDSDDDDDSSFRSDGDGDLEDEDLEGEGLEGGAMLTDEQRERERLERERIKEEERRESERRKQMERAFKVQRELRRLRDLQQRRGVENPLLVAGAGSSSLMGVGAAAGDSRPPSLSLPLLDITNRMPSPRPTPPSANPSGTKSNRFKLSSALRNSSAPNPPQPSSQYRGELSQMEREGGLYSLVTGSGGISSSASKRGFASMSGEVGAGGAYKKHAPAPSSLKRGVTLSALNGSFFGGAGSLLHAPSLPTPTHTATMHAMDSRGAASNLGVGSGAAAGMGELGGSLFEKLGVKKGGVKVSNK